MGSRAWRQRDTSRRRSRPVGLVTVTAVAGLVTALTGVAALAVSFGDVPPGHPHEAGIEFMRESGVTIGCGDGTNYCPADAVNRGQMGTFMHRLSGNAEGTPPSVNAATVMGLGPDDLQGEQGPAGPAGPEGPVGPEGPAGASAVRGRTVLSYGSTTTATPGRAFEKARDIGTFDKESDDTTLRLVLSGHARRTGGVGSVCSWQLRVDGLNRLGETSFDGTESNQYAADSTTHIESYFDDVDAGEHAVSLWVWGVGAPDCMDNPGYFWRTVVVEEIAPL
jgi:hypothetical protein